jgi:ferrous iron transport protein A
MVGIRWNPLRFPWLRPNNELPVVPAEPAHGVTLSHATSIDVPAETALAATCACPAAHCLPLAMANEGDYLRITQLLGGDGMAARLASMGLNTGCVVRVAHRQGGQTVLVRGETRLALGMGIAHRVMVTPVGSDEACPWSAG